MNLKMTKCIASFVTKIPKIQEVCYAIKFNFQIIESSSSQFVVEFLNKNVLIYWYFKQL
jgi:hypothetical protein